MRAVNLKVRASKSHPGMVYAQVSDIGNQEVLFSGWVDDAIKQCICRKWIIHNDAHELLHSLAVLGINFKTSLQK